MQDSFILFQMLRLIKFCKGLKYEVTGEGEEWKQQKYTLVRVAVADHGCMYANSTDNGEN